MMEDWQACTAAEQNRDVGLLKQADTGRPQSRCAQAKHITQSRCFSQCGRGRETPWLQPLPCSCPSWRPAAPWRVQQPLQSHMQLIKRCLPAQPTPCSSSNAACYSTSRKACALTLKWPSIIPYKVLSLYESRIRIPLTSSLAAFSPPFAWPLWCSSPALCAAFSSCRRAQRQGVGAATKRLC